MKLTVPWSVHDQGLSVPNEYSNIPRTTRHRKFQTLFLKIFQKEINFQKLNLLLYLQLSIRKWFLAGVLVDFGLETKFRWGTLQENRRGVSSRFKSILDGFSSRFETLVPMRNFEYRSNDPLIDLHNTKNIKMYFLI